MQDPAVGNLAQLSRSMEKKNIGLPLGNWKHLDFDLADLGRGDKLNPQTSITGDPGEVAPTLGDMLFGKKIKYSMTSYRALWDLIAEFGVTSIAGVGTRTLLLDSAAVNSDLTFTALDSDDPSITIRIHFRAGDNPDPLIVVTGRDIVYNARTTAGVGIDAAVDVKFALDGDGDASLLVSIAQEGDGSGLVDAFETPLAVAPKAWLAKVRPDPANEKRAVSLHLGEGGGFSAQMSTGRRSEDVSIVADGNKRCDVEIGYTSPSRPGGDTISGFLIAKSTNTGTHAVKLMGTRGRRPYDADFDAGNSLYLKVVSRTSDAVVFKAKVDTASGATDGTGFGVAAYGANTFTVARPTSSTDGYGKVIDSTSNAPIGLFGANNEPMEVCVGDVDLTDFAADDEFEIPVELGALDLTPDVEIQISAYHKVIALDGTAQDFNKGTLKLMRPYKETPQLSTRRFNVFPQGKLGAELVLERYLFDRYFRRRSEANVPFGVLVVYKIESVIPGTTFFEQVVIWLPECIVTDTKSPVSGFDVLPETVTLKAVQPRSTPVPPTDGGFNFGGFDANRHFVFQANVVTPIDPTDLADTE